MSKKDKSYAEAWIEERFSQVANAMKFGILKLQYEYMSEDEMDQRNNSMKMFAIHVLGPYNTALIKISPTAVKMVREQNPEAMESIIHGMVHELCHVHTDPLTVVAEHRYVSENQLNDAVEKVTEAMSDYVRENLKLKTKIFNVNETR